MDLLNYSLEFRNKMTFLSDEKTELKLSEWNFVYSFIIVGIVFLLICISLVRLQVVDNNKYVEASINNELKLTYEYPKRGVIYDKDGKLIAENIPSTDLLLKLIQYYSDGELDEDKLKSTTTKISEVVNLEKIIKEKLENENYSENLYRTTLEKIKEVEERDNIYARYNEIKILSGISNEDTIEIKANLNDLLGIKVIEGNKRKYTDPILYAHVLGYTGILTAEDLDKIDYLGYDEGLALNGFQDIIGKVGVEKIYDKELIGEKGIYAVEKNALGTELSDLTRVVTPVKNGENLHLSISTKAQQKMYEVLIKAMDKYKATGAAGIIEDVETGELIAIVSVPSYDINKFIGGISQVDYEKLLNDSKLPLLNRTISAQLPPGSTFKTLAAVGAIDSGAINENTIYISRNNYTFSNGVPFQEYHDKAYGSLNIYGAITMSSNIFFCETIRNWDIEELDDYYEAFGIGSYTNIDLTGEMPGRLPSPENKIALANTPGITWLEPIWYPEGDGCNSVIGQGITLVTPIQMVNWISAIANGGTLNTPHVGVKFSDAEGNEEVIPYESLNKDFVSDHALNVVRKGMRLAVAGERRTIVALTGAKIDVAAKTGTAEFGKLNSKGIYEHTHAWTTGFFPYEKPKYSFVILLEDGGESYYAADVAREYIDWWADNMSD